MTAPKCNCCKDSGNVPDILGQLRPCSRCGGDRHEAWAKARLEPVAEAPVERKG